MIENEHNGVLIPDGSKTVKSHQELMANRMKRILAGLPLSDCEFDAESLSWTAPKGFVFKVTGNFEIGIFSDQQTSMTPSKRLAINSDYWWDVDELPTSFVGKFLSLSEISEHSLYIAGPVEVTSEQGCLRDVTISLNGVDMEYLYEDKTATITSRWQPYARVDLEMSLRRFRISMIKDDQFDRGVEEKQKQEFIENFIVVPIASRPPEKLAPGDVRF